MSDTEKKPVTEENKPGLFSMGETRPIIVILAIIILIIIILIFKVGSSDDIEKVNEDMAAMKNDLQKVSFDLDNLTKKFERHGGDVVKLPCNGVCSIGNGFFVLNLKGEYQPENKTAVISGELINGLAISLENIRMRFIWLEEVKFDVGSVGPGESAPFSFTLTDVARVPDEGALVLDTADIYYRKVMKAGME